MKIFHIPLDILLLFIIPILVSIIAWARRHNCKYECVCIKKCKWYDMIWRCWCCCIEIIKCEYRAITIKWNRCKFNLSNVSIWINISKQDGNMYRSQPRLTEGYALKFENWNTSMHTLRERGLLPPLPNHPSPSASLRLSFKIQSTRGVIYRVPEYPLPIGKLAFWDNPILGHVKAETAEAIQGIF